MERTGVVISEMGDYSKVKLLRHTACGNCGACQVGDESKDILLVARNTVNAHVGDMVEVAMAANGVLSAAFIMYMIPLAALFLGLTLGSVLLGTHQQGEILSGLMAIGFMFVAFLLIKTNEKRFLKSEKYTAKIMSVLQKAHDDLVPLT